MLGNPVYNSLQGKQHALWQRAQFYRQKQCTVKILFTRTHCKREQEMRQETQAAPRQELKSHRHTTLITNLGIYSLHKHEKTTRNKKKEKCEKRL